MTKLYVLVGLPGAGKSRYAKTLNGNLISTSEIRRELWNNLEGSKRQKNKIIFEEAR